MRKFVIVAALLSICLAGNAAAQTPPPNIVGTPPVLTPVDPSPFLTALLQQSSWTQWAQDGLLKVSQNQASDETDIQKLKQQNTDLQTALSALADRVTKLENANSPPPQQPSALIADFSKQPDGLADTVSIAIKNTDGSILTTVTFSPGNWRFIGGYLSPVADGSVDPTQKNRSINFNPPVALAAVTFCCATIAFHDSTNTQSASTATLPASDTSLSTGWRSPVSSIVVGGTGSASATTLKVRSLQVSQ